jgi:hypothetical protein
LSDLPAINRLIFYQTDKSRKSTKFSKTWNFYFTIFD